MALNPHSFEATAYQFFGPNVAHVLEDAAQWLREIADEDGAHQPVPFSSLDRTDEGDVCLSLVWLVVE
jgi:hypothetical protein